jgi:phospholipid transport system transporter-binding protein
MSVAAATATPPEFSLEESAPGKFAARGALTFPTARRARELGLAALRASSASGLQVDCSGITHSDSAGMTVLLDWLSFAKRGGRSLQYDNLPAQVKDIAGISDTLEMLQQGVQRRLLVSG